MLVKLDGLARVAQFGVGDAEVAQGIAFATPVADLARDRQGLLVKLDGLARVAQRVMGEAEVTQGAAFGGGVTDDTGGACLGRQPGDKLPRVEAEAAGVANGTDERDELAGRGEGNPPPLVFGRDGE